MKTENQPTEPWLRGTRTDVAAVQRAVLPALELAREDMERWTADLSDEELNARPGDIASVAFHLRHIARSIDRLLTYAEGSELSAAQIAAMQAELHPGTKRAELWEELTAALERANARIRAFAPQPLEEARTVGRKPLPTTVGR